MVNESLIIQTNSNKWKMGKLMSRFIIDIGKLA